MKNTAPISHLDKIDDTETTVNTERSISDREMSGMIKPSTLGTSLSTLNSNNSSNVNNDIVVETGEFMEIDINEDDANFYKQQAKSNKFSIFKRRAMMVPIAIVLVVLFFGAALGVHRGNVKKNAKASSISLEDLQSLSPTQSPITVRSQLPSISKSTSPSSFASLSPSLVKSSTPSSHASNHPSEHPNARLNSLLSKTDESYGYSISLSNLGNILAVGAPNHGNGHVQIYKQRNGNQWEPYGTIVENPSLLLFGYSVHLSSNGKRICARAVHTGAVFGGIYAIIYEYAGSDALPWKQVALWSVDGVDLLQSSLTMSGDGNTVAIGHTDPRSGNGKISLFNGHDDFGFLLGSTHTMGEETISLSEDGTRLAYHDGSKVIVMQFVIENFFKKYWDPLGKPIPDLDEEEDDNEHGSSVVLSSDGNFLVISSKSKTKVFAWDTTAKDWQPFGNILSDEYNILPSSVSASFFMNFSAGLHVYRIAMASVPNNDDPNNIQNSVTRVFEYQSSDQAWSRIAIIDGSEYPSGFGTSISLSEDGLRVAIGAPQEHDGFSSNMDGQVLVFEIES